MKSAQHSRLVLLLHQKAPPMMMRMCSKVEEDSIDSTTDKECFTLLKEPFKSLLLLLLPQEVAAKLLLLLGVHQERS